MGILLSIRNNDDQQGGSSTENVANMPNSRVNLITNNNENNNNNNNNKRKKGHSLSNVSFGSHFLLAGRRFKSVINQAQSFLFGDQLDLSFILAHKPVTVNDLKA
jgi:hypothetical protein